MVQGGVPILFFDLSGSNLADDSENKQFVYFYHQHGGEIIFQLWAACCGCDFTCERSELPAVASRTLLEAFTSIDARNDLITSDSLARWIVDCPSLHCTDYSVVYKHIHYVVPCYTEKARVYCWYNDPHELTIGTTEEAGKKSTGKAQGKRNATTGTSPKYSVHREAKQRKLFDKRRFSIDRPCVGAFLESLRK